MLALHIVAETSGFIADAKAERMTTADRLALKNMLAADPEAMIVGSGGLRKLRVAGRGKGKSGRYRVLTAYVGPDAPVYLPAVLSKGDRDNFNDAEVREFARLTASIKAYWQARRSGPA